MLKVYSFENNTYRVLILLKDQILLTLFVNSAGFTWFATAKAELGRHGENQQNLNYEQNGHYIVLSEFSSIAPL